MIALIVIASLVALFLLVLCVPVELTLEADLDEERHFRIGLIWLFGLVHLSLKARRQRPSRARKAVAKEKETISFIERWHRLQTLIRILRIKNLGRQTLRLLTGVLKSIKFRDLAVDLRLGLGDPADTGMLFAFVGPFTPLISSYAPFPITIQPLLTGEPQISGHSQGRISVQPIRLAVPFSGFVFSRPAFRLIRVMVAQRWKKRR